MLLALLTQHQNLVLDKSLKETMPKVQLYHKRVSFKYQLNPRKMLNKY